jgi:hypothetical protein
VHADILGSDHCPVSVSLEFNKWNYWLLN